MASEENDSKEKGDQAAAAGEKALLPNPEELIKHPLQNRWALWFFKNDKTKDWKANLKIVTAFDTVEDFWGLYNHLQPASKLPLGCDYSLFKEGVQPMWEDDFNKRGGRWLLNLNKAQRLSDLDNLWLETLLCLIGEAFDEQSEDICGAVVNIRPKGDKLGLWTHDATNTEANTKIGCKLKERLRITKIVLGYQKGDQAAAAGEKALLPNPEELIKHPLQNRWALWFFKNDKTKDWKANLKIVTAFDTVEDFWGLYNHLQPASKLPIGCDYSLFKEGVQPMWEDDFNIRGGRWLLNLNKAQRLSDLDNLWLETLLCLIGEAFDEQSEDICGAVVNIRPKGDKLGLWTHDATNTEANTKIGYKLKERLRITKIALGYQGHSDTMAKTGSTTKIRFTV